MRKAEPGISPTEFPLSEETGLWQLIVKHRDGSLEEAVEKARYHNLIISFSILLLLGASVAMLIVATQRAQRLARQQIEFVSGVTHELRTPLTVIYTAGENLSDGLIYDLPQVKRYGSLLKNEGRRLIEMVEQILEFAGSQIQRKRKERHPVKVKALIERALVGCSHQIQENNFSVEKRVGDDLPDVLADEEEVSRAIQNLLTNAMKYSGKSRVIDIEALTKDGKRGKEVLITIKDYGLGIGPDDLPYIFEPFRRGREAIASQLHGNGLGLTLVKRIIETHGGRLNVTSTLGQGSSFTLHFSVSASSNGHSKPKQDN
ncbi:hypothetical protein BH18ACI4_BH18ACI4_11830 [soil metagenome]